MEDQILLQTIFLSNDPAQRLWIQKDQNVERGYTSPVLPGDRMRSIGIGKVLKSTSPLIKEGALVQSFLGWIEQQVINARSVTALPDLPGFSPTVFLGALGTPGIAAYFELKETCQLKEGQSIIVSGAAGATGSSVVQLAKHLFKASKVIAIAGSDKKCDWLKTIGADVALNYKSPSFSSDLVAAARPLYVDCFFDTVGGVILNVCLSVMKRNGRIVVCGAISVYNDKSQLILDNWLEVISNRLNIKGFSVLDYFNRREEAVQVLTSALKEGKLSVTGGETLVRCVFEQVPGTWIKLFSGENTGKFVTQIADL
ncbi:hypothetical protein GYMLUDRAFT_36031 [Collybiopsis luxurians FD-317 M1]|nr:hypothetical protein GYMLUDRAFT_36031 [Collybiopsis luxurians FD-317 M1]